MDVGQLRMKVNVELTNQTRLSCFGIDWSEVLKLQIVDLRQPMEEEKFEKID